MQRRSLPIIPCLVVLCLGGLATTATAQPAVDQPQATETETGQPGAELTETDAGTATQKQDDEDYFELLKLFADTLDQVERNYVEEVSRRELMEAAIKGVLAKLDQYSDYIAPEQFDDFRTGVESEFGGIGIRVGVIDGKLTVITPLLGTPAYRAGIMTGDQILKIGDASTDGMTLEDAISRMKGRLGSSIKIRVLHKDDGVEEQATLERELVQMETVLGERRRDDDQWDFLYDDSEKIGYIRITSFSGRTAHDLRIALDRLVAQEMKSLILDLRFNPGGLLSSAIDVADMFVKSGTIVSTAGRNTAERVWSATPEGSYDGFKILVMVNRYSASASEIVAACLQDHERAIVIGERSWGKGSVQNIIELEGGRSALKLTTGGYKRPSGKNIHRSENATDDDDWGVQPNEGLNIRMRIGEMRRLLAYHRDRDILLTPADKKKNPPAAYVDRQLQAALDHLRK